MYQIALLIVLVLLVDLAISSLPTVLRVHHVPVGPRVPLAFVPTMYPLELLAVLVLLVKRASSSLPVFLRVQYVPVGQRASVGNLPTMYPLAMLTVLVLIVVLGNIKKLEVRPVRVLHVSPANSKAEVAKVHVNYAIPGSLQVVKVLPPVKLVRLIWSARIPVPSTANGGVHAMLVSIRWGNVPLSPTSLVLLVMRASFPTSRTASGVRVAHPDNPSPTRGSPPVPPVPQKRTTREAILRLAASVLTVPIM